MYLSAQGTINKTIYMDEIMTDLNHVLTIDADHVAGLILRGSFDPKEQEQKLYSWKACRKNPDAQVFIPITDLNHPDINRFGNNRRSNRGISRIKHWNYYH